MRITLNHLECQIETLNHLTGQPKKPYHIAKEGIVSNVGNYHLAGEYGGYKLEQIVNKRGAVAEITQFRMTKKELYYTIHAMNNLLRSQNKVGGFVVRQNGRALDAR